jgi:gamma-glutamyltranspeptidase/glutathione hydrolase
VNIIDFGMNIQQAGDAPRVQHLHSATPTGLPAKGAGIVSVESTIPEAVLAVLRAKGHKLQFAKNGGEFGGYQGIWIDWQNGVLRGATEPRKDGCAVGY